MKVKYGIHTCSTKSFFRLVTIANSYSRRKFSAAFTSRTKTDRSDNLISNNEIAAEMSMFSILFMYFALFLKEQPCGDEKMSLQVKGI